MHVFIQSAVNNLNNMYPVYKNEKKTKVLSYKKFNLTKNKIMLQFFLCIFWKLF